MRPAENHASHRSRSYMSDRKEWEGVRDTGAPKTHGGDGDPEEKDKSRCDSFISNLKPADATCLSSHPSQ